MNSEPASMQQGIAAFRELAENASRVKQRIQARRERWLSEREPYSERLIRIQRETIAAIHPERFEVRVGVPESLPEHRCNLLEKIRQIGPRLF